MTEDWKVDSLLMYFLPASGFLKAQKLVHVVLSGHDFRKLCVLCADI